MKSNIYQKSLSFLFALAILGAFYNNGFSQTTNNQISASTENTAKTARTIRVGLAGVKSGSVGEGINGQELAGAVQNTLGEYLKGTRVELVSLDAKTASAVDAEIKEKQCDFVLNAQVSHKKGGGGFGMFKNIAPVLTAVVPMAGVGAMIAGSVASTVINAGATSNVKPKDELTLDVKINSANGGAQTFAKQFKTKAKSGGEDIITPMVEQAAQAILDAVVR